MGYFVGSFDGTGYDVGSTCVGILVGVIMNDPYLDYMQLNDSSPVSCKS